MKMPLHTRLRGLTGFFSRNKNLLIPLVLFLLVELAALAGVFVRPELALYDSWFRLQGVRDPGRQVAVVAVDEPSIKELGPLAWPRKVHAQLLEKLREARVVAFDIVFDAPTTPADDRSFAAAIAEHGGVVLASQFSFEENGSGEMEQIFQAPLPEFMEGAAGLGFVNMPTDVDGVVRRVTMVDVNTFEIPFPSLSLASAMTALGMNPAQIELEPGCLRVAGGNIPVDGMNRAMIDFWGPQGTFKTYGYADVLRGKYPPEEFKDKIVLVGVTTPAAHDEKPTPYTTSNMIISGSIETPGVEIHASAVQSFLDGHWYRPVHPLVNIAFLFIAGMATALAVGGRGPWRGIAGALAVVAVSGVLVYGLWWQGRLWLNFAAPLALIFITYVVVTASDFILAEMGRRRTRALFSRYVSPAVVEELMADPDSVSLGGQRRDLTIMFVDIRGFTAYSENKAPEQVVNRLNEYLTAMTEVIFRHGGTLDKYLGDGLMAIYGAPIQLPDHVQRAIRTAVEIQEVVEGLNNSWAEKGEPPLKIGVGINTGSVLVGNVGSPERMDYTVIGEDVNLASRVEGLTKTFGALVIISERTVRVLEARGESTRELEYLGTAEVKGFTLPIGVYTVPDRRTGKFYA